MSAPTAFRTRPYQSMPWPGFGGGINLRDQPDAVAPVQAVDCLDVSFTQRGAVKQRDGYDNFSSSELTNRPDSMSVFYTASGTKQLVVGNGNRLDVLSTAGASTANSTSPTASPHFFARIGTPSTEKLYISNGTDTVRTWDGSSFATPSYTGTTPTGKFVALMAQDNRLACACTATNPSRVLFSDAGTPTTFGANNYVDLTPGDGEAITGMVSWANLLFVFKESRYFVFYGNSTDSTGAPVFNYRTVDTNCGLVASQAVTRARDGVYFMDRKGVYHSSGGAPQLVSGVLDPLFIGGLSGFYSGAQISQANITAAAMRFHEERLYVAVPTSASTNDRLLVFDPRFGWWSVWSIPAGAMTSFRISNQPELVFAYSSGSKHVGRHSSAYTNDDGTIISSSWRSGWLDMGSADIKTIREFKCFGIGKCQVGWAKDFQNAPQSTTTVDFTQAIDTWGDGTGTDTWEDGTGTDTWSAGRVLTEQLVRKAVRGTLFSFQITSYLTNAWTMERVTTHVRESEVSTKVKVD